MIQLDSDKVVQSVRFSKKGTELSGTLKSTFAGKCHFTGVKVQSRPHNGQVDPEAQWVNRSEAVYNYGMHERWEADQDCLFVSALGISSAH